jgi:serine/threonine protein kinase
MDVGGDPPGLIRVRRINDAARTDPVYLALRIADATEVAVRVYRAPVRAARDRARFEREVAALRALAGSPHVLAPRDAGFTTTDRPYVVTDYCRAGSLQDHLTGVGRLTPTEVRRAGAALALTLARAHRRGVVHRRISPANVLVTAGGTPALTDFGLVSVDTADGRYQPPRSTRTRPFLAPEAFLPELMAPAADIYALGATLYALLAGWGPRTADPSAPTLDGDSLADLPKVPFALMSIIRTAMALDPRERYDDAEQLAAALAG